MKLHTIIIIGITLACTHSFSISARTRKNNISSPNQPLSLPAPQTTASVSLHLFDRRGASLSGRGSGPNGILQRLKVVIIQTASQFSSGYVMGYVLSGIWGLLRGTTKPGGWALDFGCLSAIFGGCNASARLFFNVHESSLWNVVVRNVLLAFYFGRHEGLFSMMRNAVIYGSLTYFFVSQKEKRDALRSSPAAGTTATPPVAAMTMEELLQRMNHRATPPTTSTTTTTTPPPETKQTVKPVSTDLKSNAVDVEWERVDTNKKDENDDKK